MSKETVIEKIKKLLVRTEENGCTPGEAQAAAAQVAMLLAKYDLELGDVNSAETECIVERCGTTKSVSVYQTALANALAEHFGISLFVSSRRGYPSVLKAFGERFKVNAFQEVFAFSYNAFRQCWTSYHKKLSISTEEKNSLRMSYLRGFIDGLTNEIIREENANALVVSKSQKVRDFEGTFQGVHKFTYKDNFNADAISKGYQDGAFAQRNKSKSLYV